MLDSDFASVSLLLHGDGASGSTSVVDSGPLALTGSAVGAAAISTAQKKWGSGSFVFDGAGDYLTFAANSAFGFGTGDFTVEAWVFLVSGNGSGDKAILLGRTSGDMSFGLNNGSLQFGAVFVAYDVVSSSLVPTGSWQHVAATRSGSTLRVFIGGVQVGSATQARSYGGAGALDVGGSALGDGLSLNAYVDDVRITKGVARYTGNFTPPTEAFPNVGGIGGLVAAAGPLGAPAALGSHTVVVQGRALHGGLLGAPRALGILSTTGRVAVASVLRAPSVVAAHDFGAVIVGAREAYLLDVETPSGVVRVPAGSWQATLRAQEPSYLQCVVPAASPWIERLAEGTAFRVIRSARTAAGMVIESEIAAAVLESLSLAQGGLNYSATLSGYSDPIDAPPGLVRQLVEIRTVFTYATGYRVRCAIDWLLRPGHTAAFNETTFPVRYISYYVQGSDEFMDVGQ